MQELLEILGIPYTGSGVLACSRAMDKVLTKHLLLEAGIPTPEFFAFNQTAFRELGAAEALPAIEERLDFPIVVKPSSQGSALGHQVRAHRGRRARRAGGGVLLRRAGAARAPRGGPRPGGVGARGPGRAGGAAGGRGRARATRTSTTSRRATTSGAPRSCAPRSCPDGVTEPGPRSWRWPPTGCSACYGFGRVDLMLDADGELFVLEANPIPGLTETSLLPQAAEAAGIGFDELVGRILELAFEPAPGRPRLALAGLAVSPRSPPA